MYIFYLTFLSLLAPVLAWFPGEHKTIIADDGTDLFNSKPGYQRNSTKTKRWTPASGKIRGVNLGGMFVVEPWLASSEWSNMGCGDYNSEFDCVVGLGQSKANAAFQAHWDSWVTQSDIIQMQSYGLNTIRIPVGYWMYELLVYSDSEHFPQGGLAYLEQICGWASSAGIYIIIDLHGAPGAQVADNSDTGQYASSPGFYVDYQFDRATSFLSWLTTQIHLNSNFRNVGMLGIVNEPVQDSGTCASMLSSFYPDAYSAIRSAESALGVSSNNNLHVEMMNIFWGSGNPTSYLSNTKFVAYDDHRYVKYDPSVTISHAGYMEASCHDDRSASGETPTIVGEFSLSVATNVEDTAAWSPSTQQTFYKNWFAAQITSYETYAYGWIFWTWKAQLGDYRWSYKDAVAAGVIPEDLDDIYDLDACDGY